MTNDVFQLGFHSMTTSVTYWKGYSISLHLHYRKNFQISIRDYATGTSTRIFCVETVSTIRWSHAKLKKASSISLLCATISFKIRASGKWPHTSRSGKWFHTFLERGYIVYFFRNVEHISVCDRIKDCIYLFSYE